MDSPTGRFRLNLVDVSINLSFCLPAESAYTAECCGSFRYHIMLAGLYSNQNPQIVIHVQFSCILILCSALNGLSRCRTLLLAASAKSSLLYAIRKLVTLGIIVYLNFIFIPRDNRRLSVGYINITGSLGRVRNSLSLNYTSA